MKKRWWITFGIMAAVLVPTASVVYLSTTSEVNQDSAGANAATSSEESTAGVSADTQSALIRLKEKAAKLAESRKQDVPSDVPSIEGFSAETIRLAHEIFNEMHAVRGLVHTHELRAVAAKELLAAPKGLELVHRTSIDPAFARRAFGEKQAEARHYAILTMGEAASDGASEMLFDAITQVSNTLKSAEKIDVGQREDLRELLVTYTGVLPTATLAADTVQRLGYDESMPRELKQVYYESVFSRLWKEEGIEAAKIRLKEIFPAG